MVWTMNKESMQTKSWLTDWGGGQGYAEREAGTSVLNYYEQFMMSWHWFVDKKQLMEKCIRTKADMSWKERSGYNN